MATSRRKHRSKARVASAVSRERLRLYRQVIAEPCMATHGDRFAVDMKHHDLLRDIGDQVSAVGAIRAVSLVALEMASHPVRSPEAREWKIGLLFILVSDLRRAGQLDAAKLVGAALLHEARQNLSAAELARHLSEGPPAIGSEAEREGLDIATEQIDQYRENAVMLSDADAFASEIGQARNDVARLRAEGGSDDYEGARRFLARLARAFFCLPTPTREASKRKLSVMQEMRPEFEADQPIGLAMLDTADEIERCKWPDA